ncbi:MAG: patatin-like phospholipase family protein, partial [Bradyrhizobium sp.]
GEAVLLDEGSPGDAVRASAAVPGATVPVAYAGGHLVDGGVGSLVPVRFARAMGADIVIAVDIYCSGSGIDGLGAATVVRRAMRAQTCPLAKQELDEADIAIQADVPLPQLSAAESWQEAINAGYKAAKTALAPIER